MPGNGKKRKGNKNKSPRNQKKTQAPAARHTVTSAKPSPNPRFSLKDEALKSTRNGSKRLLLGAGVLRNSPVLFIKASEPWKDPNEHLLRRQMEALRTTEVIDVVPDVDVPDDMVRNSNGVQNVDADEHMAELDPGERLDETVAIDEATPGAIYKAPESPLEILSMKEIAMDEVPDIEEAPTINFDAVLQNLEDADNDEVEVFVNINCEPSPTENVPILEKLSLEENESHAQREEAISTPWARIIDETVYTTSSAPITLEFTPFRTRSMATRRVPLDIPKQRENISNTLDQDLIDDYIQNARWSSDESSSELDPQDSTAASQDEIDFQSKVSDADPMLEEVVDELSDSDESTSDSEFDDDLDLAVEAQMEEEAFQLGYRRGGYDFDDTVEFDILPDDDILEEEHDQFFEEILGASGKHKRGLNKFIDELDLSDEELEETLISQWKLDRDRKRAKKQSRQKQHQQGLVGKRAKRAKASHDTNGRQLDDFHAHIKRFVFHQDYSGIEELPMPSMDKATRRAVHIVSQVYGLKSSSQGSGKKRYITLYKTKHSCSTPEPELVERILLQAKKSLGTNAKFRNMLPREPVTRRQIMKGVKSTGSASRLRDGDIVGADAPEIEAGNRGRVLLEKLGWLHGSGLGLTETGISIPICATIKTTKFGLGT